MSLPAPRPIRVLLISESPGLGGVEVVMAQIAEHADRTRFVFSAFLPKGSGPSAATVRTRLRALGVAVTERPRAGRYDPRWVAALLAHARASRADVAHLHLHHVYACEHLFAPLRLAGVPAIVVTEHIDPDVRATLEPLRALVKRANLRIIDRTFVVSRSLETLLRDRYRAPADRVERVGNGVDLARFASPRARDEVRRELGLGAGDFVVLAVARLHPQKGLADLIDAVAALRKTRGNVRLVVAGEGGLRTSLEARAREVGLEGAARFLGHRNDVPDLLAAADVYALPSHFEGLPLGVLEAMAAGTPVVATAVSGTPDVVTDGRTGLLVPVGNVAALAAAIERLAASPDLARQLAQEAGVFVRDHHDVRAVVRRVCDGYERLSNPGR